MSNEDLSDELKLLNEGYVKFTIKNTRGNMMLYQAKRGDEVEQWIKWFRDNSYEKDSNEWHVIDGLLNDYREHADYGTPLNGITP